MLITQEELLKRAEAAQADVIELQADRKALCRHIAELKERLADALQQKPVGHQTQIIGSIGENKVDLVIYTHEGNEP